MTETEHFELVLKEVEGLIAALYKIGLHDSTVLVGAQVVALEQRARKQRLFEIALPTGLTLPRAFSYEPDLLFDTDDSHRLEALPEAMREAGFARVHQAGKPARWSKKVGDITVDVDLFGTAAEKDTSHSASLPQIRGARRLLLKEVRLSEAWTIKVPDACAYLSLKLEAKLRIRPKETKDSADLFAYAHVVGNEAIATSLDKQQMEGDRVRSELGQLFREENSPGVTDVVSSLGANLADEERALLVRAVLDTFEPLL